MALQSNWGENINEYEVLNLLGKGGFASVYKARCLKSNQYVAIKMIDKSLIQDPAMTNRVRQEVEIHSRLKHPSVLELYTFFQDSNYVYLVLELASNGELQRYLKQTMRRPMTELEAATVLQQVVAGLLYLHSHNIMHRDISLSNLLLSKDMHVKIADFGLATQLKQPNERHVTMCGTPNFISPEVVSRVSHGLPADVWGIGCMLFTLLVGHPPFDTDAVQATLNRVVMSDYHIPSCVSQEGRDLIEKLLKKNPSERISLENVLQHPFMTRFNMPSFAQISSMASQDNRTISSCDSGIVTFATSTPSTSCRAFSRTYGCDFDERFFTETNKNNLSEEIRAQKPIEINIGLQKPHPAESHIEEYCERYTLNTKFGARQENVFLINTPLQPNNCNEATPKINPESKYPVNHISVPPLNTARLQPTRYKTKSAIMSILKQGVVVIEFTKYRAKYNSDRVTDICWISGDGGRIIVYHSDSGRGLPISDNAPEMPKVISPDCIFSYENLPSKHWKKYVYAARFVSLVKSKTPKVTYFSPQAKCALMESLEDFECCFYDGSKVIASSNNIPKVYDVHGRQLNLDVDYQLAKPLIEHQKTCLDHCMSLNKTLELLVLSSSHCCFPIVIGRRPNIEIQSQFLSANKRESSNILKHSSTPHYQGSISNFSQSGSTKAPYDNSLHHQHSIGSQKNIPIKRVNLNGVGVATELSHGVLQIQLENGSLISVIPSAQGGGITYTNCSGVSTHFGPHDDLPLQVRDKISHLPTIERMLKQCSVLHDRETETKFHQVHFHGAFMTPKTSSTSNSMKFLR